MPINLPLSNCCEIAIETHLPPSLSLQLAKDLLHPLPAEEKRKHKLKRLVQHPNSYFMDVKCPGCYKITTVFSHAQGVVVCTGCSTILCQPTGGRAKLTEGKRFCPTHHQPLTSFVLFRLQLPQEALLRRRSPSPSSDGVNFFVRNT
jgi:small subunit ribosomal protein S27e